MSRIHPREAKLLEMIQERDLTVDQMAGDILALKAEIDGLRSSRDDWRNAYDAAIARIGRIEAAR